MSDQVLSQEEIDALFMTMAAENKEGNQSVMSDKYETIAQSLRKIGEELDTVGLSDSEGWKKLSKELDAAIREMPEELSILTPALDACASGLNILSGKTSLDGFSLVDAIYETLSGAEKYVSEGSGNEDTVIAVAQSLTDLLDQETEDAPSDAEDLTDFTLNDAAALLVQVEPEDTEELARLGALLASMANSGAHADPIREMIDKAAEQIVQIVQGGMPDPDSAIIQAGRFIEDALNAMSDSEKMTGPQGAKKESVKTDAPSAADMPSPKKENRRGAKKTEPAAVTDSEEFEISDPDETDYMPNDSESELLSAFITESSELITNAEDALLALETDPEDMEAIGSVFRAFHTIKGTAAFLELSLISEMGHHAESLLSRVRDREIRYSGGYADLSLRTLDMLKELILSVQEALGGKPLLKPIGYPELMRLLEDPEKAGITDETEDPEPTAAESTSRVGDILVAQGKVKREAVEKAMADKNKNPIGSKLVKSKAASVTDVAHALRTQRNLEVARRQVVDSSVRVPTERLDRFIDTVGELVVAHSMVAQDEIVASGKHHDLFKKVTLTNKIVRELQDMSMSMRMIPFKATFRKMARLVRDLARKIGKNVTFLTEGEDTEIDRNMVDIINDPLVHMVRNAIDHGIELPEVRQKAGKPPHGTLKLSAYHSAGSVVVEIQDDGKGLDRHAIVEKAIERGLITDGGGLSDRDVFNLVFEPGFSTAQVVSDVSGRGVGMDVVKKSIENLRGQIDIQSKPGKGSVFKMSLPLTLAIIDGMVVRIGTEKYVIPTVSIIRSVKPEPKDLSSVFHKGEMLMLQGKLIPLFRLSRLFEIKNAEEDPTKALVVVVENHMNHAGLLIDELIGTQQIVIKTLGETMSNIPGISGSAIMPNGRVGLILDVGGLVRLANASGDEF